MFFGVGVVSRHFQKVRELRRIACLDGGESTGLDELLSRADAALYRAKNEGRLKNIPLKMD